METQHQQEIKQFVTELDHAFQPIVNIHTGFCYGYEVLLRNHQELGFKAIDHFYDYLAYSGSLAETDLLLRIKAIQKFATFSDCRRTKLFYNLDSRLFYTGRDVGEETISILTDHNLGRDHICFELSEKRDLSDIEQLRDCQVIFRDRNINIAVDDCGTGFSGLQLLYYTEPNLTKIDRFFIRDISRDSKKRLFVSTIVNLAHLLGSLVVAEGVETEQEFYSCRDIGCDLVQGYLVQKPTLNIKELKNTYEHIHHLGVKDRRIKQESDRQLITSEVVNLQPVSNSTSVVDVFEEFLTRKQGLLPVINEANEPVGMIKESVFKEYAYSRYGRELLERVSRNQTLLDFVNPFPVADIHSSIEKVLEIYSLNENLEGIIITENQHYLGFLSAQSLLKVLNDKNLVIARDLNPLTKLPGNILIHEYVSTALTNTNDQYYLVYYDFDNFKAYNDRYGFRQGDRALHLFAKILKRKASQPHHFIGHIGGDDYFMGVGDEVWDNTLAMTQDIINTFKKDVISFYDGRTIDQGFIEAKDRDGEKKRFPLMTISAVLISLPPNRKRVFSQEEMSGIIAKMKKQSKSCSSGLCCLNARDIEDFPFDEQYNSILAHLSSSVVETN